MRMQRAAVMIGGLALAGCVPASRPAPAPAPPPVTPTPAMPAVGLERVMGRNVAQLVRLLGQPDLDMRERVGRRLQFAGTACVLDAYLYPPKRGGEAVVTYIDARLPNGNDIDRASCVAALARDAQR